MSKVSVFDNGWIDLVFEGRNQSYGAYQLRKEDSRTTILALITGIALMGALVAIPVAINYFSADLPPVIETPALPDQTIVPVEMVEPYVEPKKPDPITPDAAGPAPASSAATTASTTLVATSLPVTTPIPTTATLLTTDPGTITTPGTIGGSTTGTPGGTGSATSTGTSAGPGNGIETAMTVDAMPAFPGGIEAFYQQVSRKFMVPETDTAKTLKVYVSFVVELDGSMSNIKVGRDPGYGMANEAMRVLKSIKTKWTPGKKKGQPVRTAYNLPITINVK